MSAGAPSSAGGAGGTNNSGPGNQFTAQAQPSSASTSSAAPNTTVGTSTTGSNQNLNQIVGRDPFQFSFPFSHLPPSPTILVENYFRHHSHNSSHLFHLPQFRFFYHLFQSPCPKIIVSTLDLQLCTPNFNLIVSNHQVLFGHLIFQLFRDGGADEEAICPASWASSASSHSAGTKAWSPSA